MHKATIAFAGKGHSIPKEWFENALKEYPTVLGAAALVTVDNKPKFDVARIAQSMPIEKIMQVQKKYENSSLMFYLGAFPPGFSDEDIQPYTLLNTSKGEPILIAFAEGDWSPMHQEKSTHSDEFYLAHSYLGKKIQKLNSLVGGDFTRLVEELQDETFREDLMGKCGDKCVLAMMLVTGKLLVFSKGRSEIKIGEHCWVTNLCGYGTEAPKPVEENKPSGDGGMFDTDVVIEKNDSASNTPTVLSNTVIPEVKTEATAIGDALNMGQVFLRCPANLNAKASRNWHRLYVGYVPTNYRDRPHCIPIAKKMSHYRGFKKTPDGFRGDIFREKPSPFIFAEGQYAESAPVETHTQPSTPSPEEKKEPNIVVTPSVKPAEGKPDEKSPLISADSKKKGQAIIKKYLDKSGNNILDPKFHQEMEANLPTFVEAMGLKDIMETFHWDATALRELFTEAGVDALVLLCMNYRKELVDMMNKSTNVSDLPAGSSPVSTTSTPKIAVAGGKGL